MKYLLIAFTMMAALFSKGDSGGKINVAPDVLTSFHRDYERAKEINWTTVKGLYEATFTLNEKLISAYYNPEGELVTVIQHISSLELPHPLQTNLKSKLQNCWISDLLEVGDEDGIKYYVMLENADTKTVLISANAKKWSVYRTEAKG